MDKSFIADLSGKSPTMLPKLNLSTGQKRTREGQPDRSKPAVTRRHSAVGHLQLDPLVIADNGILQALILEYEQR
jgi:hypothetical protein